MRGPFKIGQSLASALKQQSQPVIPVEITKIVLLLGCVHSGFPELCY